MFQFQFHLDLNEIPIPEIDTLFGICSKYFLFWLEIPKRRILLFLIAVLSMSSMSHTSSCRKASLL